MKSRNRNPDDIEIQLLSNTTHYGGIPYDPGLYANTLFSVVSECHCNTIDDRPPWLTEKTYIPILNNVPFIIAGDNGSLSSLKGLGFRTFEQYLPFPNYDSISDKSRKIDAVLENTQFWITNMKDTTSIAEDIAHNHLRLLELYARNKQTLMAMCDKHNLDKNRIDEIINPDL